MLLYKTSADDLFSLQMIRLLAAFVLKLKICVTYPMNGCGETYGLLLHFPVSLLRRRSTVVSIYPVAVFPPDTADIQGIESKLNQTKTISALVYKLN